MSENALLYQLLVNKQKLRPLNIKQDEQQQNLVFHLDNNNDDVVNDNNILHHTNQIFNKHCKSSHTVTDNVKLFNEFLENEMPLIISKFEKYSLGKTE
jgi:hypothetical protein